MNTDTGSTVDYEVFDTDWGPLAAGAVPAGEVNAGDHIVGEPIVDGDGRTTDRHHVYEVVDNTGSRLDLHWLTTNFRTHDVQPTGAPYEPGEAFYVVAATMYDNDGGREVHDQGQIRFGALLVLLLRDAAGDVWPEDTDPQTVHDVLDYAIDTGLIEGEGLDGSEPVAITDTGQQLLDLLDPLYPDCLHWQSDPESAANL